MNQDVAPEIFIGLCGAVGTDMEIVKTELEKNLAPLGISSVHIKASELIAEAKGAPDVVGENDRITEYMKRGNAIRADLQKGDGVARLAIARIRKEREKRSDSEQDPSPNTAYIINSLKHPDEYEMLTRLYGDAFLMISVYESWDSRHRNLCKKIAKSNSVHDADTFREEASKLIDLDQDDSESLGQSVRDVFPLGDIFLSAGSSFARQMKRAVSLFMGAPFITPNIDEYGMFHAHSVAVRSADLSRQVGAVISTQRGDVLAMGCNEVPQVGGGAYWEDYEGEIEDRRDFRIGYDSTSALKKELISEIVDEFKKADGWLPTSYQTRETSEIADELISKKSMVSLSGKRISSVLEYGRIVHAEMSALMDAARRGEAVENQTLYCTTFPCHMCARHIISAGIRRVVYVEPYPKSLAKRLYPKEISLDGDADCGQSAVQFEPFVGIAPKRFMTWFKSGGRKDSLGFALANQPQITARKIALQDADRTSDEALVVASLGIYKKNESPPRVKPGKKKGKQNDAKK